MKSRWIYWVIAVFIAGMASGIGFILFRDEGMPFWVIQCIAVASLLLASIIYQFMLYGLFHGDAITHPS